MKKKIKLVSIDVDGCLVQYKNVGSKFQSAWGALSFAYGLKEIWDKRAEQLCKEGGNDLIFAQETIADLKGKSFRQAEKVLYPIPYSLGAEEFVKKTNGKLIRGLLSASIDLVAKRAAEELDLDFVFCNKIHKEKGYFTGTLDYDVPIWKKHEKIREICDKYEVFPEEICHIGDSDNDISVGERVGFFVAFDPKPNLLKYIQKNNVLIINDFRKLERIIQEINGK